jgi:hypothetical protein
LLNLIVSKSGLFQVSSKIQKMVGISGLRGAGASGCSVRVLKSFDESYPMANETSP